MLSLWLFLPFSCTSKWHSVPSFPPPPSFHVPCSMCPYVFFVPGVEITWITCLSHVSLWTLTRIGCKVWSEVVRHLSFHNTQKLPSSERAETAGHSGTRHLLHFSSKTTEFYHSFWRLVSKSGGKKKRCSLPTCPYGHGMTGH